MADKLPRARLSPQQADALRNVIRRCDHICATVTGPGIELGLPLQDGHAEAQRQANFARSLLKLCGCAAESSAEGI